MLEDLLLGELALEQAREPQLYELASEGTAVVAAHQEAVARDLHRDGAEPFADAECGYVANHRARSGAPVDAVMEEEAFVFRGDECLKDVFWNAVEWNVHAAHNREVSD